MFLSQPKSPLGSESKFVRQLWLALWALFAVSLFVSKSGISIFGTVLLLWSVFKIDWKKSIQQNPWFLVILSIFPLAILVSWVSIGGAEAASKVFSSWAWPLYIIPFSLLFQDKKAFKLFCWSLAVGLVVSFANSIFIFGNQWNWTFNSATRVASFWDISRWGYFLSCTSVALFALLGHEQTIAKFEKIEKIAVYLMLGLSLAFLVLANTRGPWLAVIVGIFALGISGKRYLKLLCGFLVFVVLSTLAVPGTLDRLQSSFSAKTENGVVTSKDASNAGRLHMWQVNLQFAKEHLFLGTGFESVEAPLRAFIDQQGVEYREKYVDPEFSFNDQHSSYLQMLVQMGVFYFAFIWGVVAILMIMSIPDFFRNQDIWVKTAFSLVVTQLFMFIFYSSISSFEGLWFYPMLLVLSAVIMQHKAKRKMA
ncbi:O-antigen ligase family protein [Bdellovibrio sp. HCB274]|uniref:O-antigen ligase family protein n=1 Tax=Bdellovibrio sp. HCB274 TaxID=3394361 RepID=UPI0039B457D5